MRLLVLALALSVATAAQAAPAPLTPADKAAAFKAAGFKPKGREWVRCDDTQTSSHQNGSIEVADLNGDGAPEAWVRESSVFCYGNTAEAFVLVTKRPTGWTILLDEVGIANPLATKHNGWPDIEVGGPGFGPSPKYRYNGVKYVAGR
ncbi:MAG: hypothetical protein Q8M88_15015 [Phenylobacterium sp.]|uniref:hypothetical protein n=1 Tax=Phenylobacterium sp. TaxID=1871053 RepID=UPI002732AF51|nr:hypothetical protein [Phenylobacterium sp.]MDP3175740.1 hypothetical protein [Phenylobacterium sp.]